MPYLPKMITNYMYPVEHIKKQLKGKKIVWIGGGIYLAQPTIFNFLCGCIAYSFEEDFSNDDTIDKDLFINLEDYTPSRPDWNRLTDRDTFSMFPDKKIKKMLECWKNSFVFPYYVSTYAYDFAKNIGSMVIGNLPSNGESLYLRNNARLIAKKAGMHIPDAMILKSNQLPDFDALLSAFSCSRLVLTPPYSDGGAWVYPIENKEQLAKAFLEVTSAFQKEYIEISPYYDGISMNVNVCNAYNATSNECHVVVYPPSIQIIGDPSLSDGKLRYCGCDFKAASNAISNDDLIRIFKFSVKIGKLLFINYGWKGFFGIDFILCNDGKFIFLEINPRLQSSTYILDIEIRNKLNPMLMHINSFFGNSCVFSDTDMTRYRINHSMAISYNNKDIPMTCVFDGNVNNDTHEMYYGFPKKGKIVDHGGVLFRWKGQCSILSDNMKMIGGELSRNILEKKKLWFSY